MQKLKVWGALLWIEIYIHPLQKKSSWYWIICRAHTKCQFKDLSWMLLPNWKVTSSMVLQTFVGPSLFKNISASMIYLSSLPLVFQFRMPNIFTPCLEIHETLRLIAWSEMFKKHRKIRILRRQHVNLLLPPSRSSSLRPTPTGSLWWKRRSVSKHLHVESLGCSTSANQGSLGLS